MRITGAIPINIARAYGVAPAKRAAPANPVAQVRPEPKVDAREPSANVQQLVAARVDQPVDFAPVRPPASASGAYQLYNRVADKIEAAVAVQIGRAIDVKG